MKDWLGVEIKPRCHVVYPGRQSSTLWMTLGRVEELHEGEEGQAPGVLLTRLKELRWRGHSRVQDVDPKQVKVDARHLTVVRTAEEIESALHPKQYLVRNPNISVETTLNPGQIWTLPGESEIKIDPGEL